MHTLLDGVHIDKLALTVAHLFHYRGNAALRYVDDEAVNRLTELAVDFFIYYAGGADGEFVAVAAHVFHEYRKVHFASAAYAVAVRRIGFVDAEAHVLHGFFEEVVTDVTRGDVFAFSAGERRVVDAEGHFDGRFTDFDKGQRLGRVDIRYGVADGDIVKSGHTDYVADHCSFGGYAPQTVDLEHGGDAVFAHEIGVMVVADGNLLLEVEGAALYSADGDLADIVVIVNGGDEHLCGGFFVAFGRRDV